MIAAPASSTSARTAGSRAAGSGVVVMCVSAPFGSDRFCTRIADRAQGRIRMRIIAAIGAVPAACPARTLPDRGQHMARIVGAIATSHTPTIGFAVDGRKQQDPVWKPIFDAYAPITAWLKAQRPDVLFIVYNDHVTSFFFDHYSAFCLGIGEEYAVADEG